MGRFPELTQKMGFGMLRIPLVEDGVVDVEKTNEIVDCFLDGGFNYFDTSHNYIGGASERAIKSCISSRHPRDSFVLANKLSRAYFNCYEDIRPLFESQLEICGVDYFDFYLMHSQNLIRYNKFKSQGAYDIVKDFKKEGKIRHLGISFHDKADVLDMILRENPHIEAVQIQFNYYDYDSPSIESKKVYDVCRKYDKAVFIMEPLRGGSLVNNLPDDAKEEFARYPEWTPAAYGYRFAASFEGVELVLSGSNTIDQMRENMETMRDFRPLSEEEMDLVFRVAKMIKAKGMIDCTSCRYCMEGCPKHIRIPEIFSLLNAKTQFSGDSWSTEMFYHEDITTEGNKASDCIKCGSCERECPQGLPIRELLDAAVEEFEKKPRTIAGLGKVSK